MLPTGAWCVVPRCPDMLLPRAAAIAYAARSCSECCKYKCRMRMTPCRADSWWCVPARPPLEMAKLRSELALSLPDTFHPAGSPPQLLAANAGAVIVSSPRAVVICACFSGRLEHSGGGGPGHGGGLGSGGGDVSDSGGGGGGSGDGVDGDGGGSASQCGEGCANQRGAYQRGAQQDAPLGSATQHVVGARFSALPAAVLAVAAVPPAWLVEPSLGTRGGSHGGGAERRVLVELSNGELWLLHEASGGAGGLPHKLRPSHQLCARCSGLSCHPRSRVLVSCYGSASPRLSRLAARSLCGGVIPAEGQQGQQQGKPQGQQQGQEAAAQAGVDAPRAEADCQVEELTGCSAWRSLSLPRWSPDGEALAFWSHAYGLVVGGVAGLVEADACGKLTAAEVTSATWSAGEVESVRGDAHNIGGTATCLEWSMSGLLAAGCSDDRVRVWAVQGRQHLRATQIASSLNVLHHASFVSGICWCGPHSDSTLLARNAATAATVATIATVATATSSARQGWAGGKEASSGVSGGEQARGVDLASCSYDGSVMLWQLLPGGDSGAARALGLSPLARLNEAPVPRSLCASIQALDADEQSAQPPQQRSLARLSLLTAFGDPVPLHGIVCGAVGDSALHVCAGYGSGGLRLLHIEIGSDSPSEFT